jgi:cytochrome c oxidase accessory protein FixG
VSLPLPPPERVLPTLNQDGTRRWIRPRLFQGRFYRARLLTAWGLIALFVALPFVRLGGKPAVLLDVQHRKFVLFGTTFLPTDGVLLMLLLLAIFLGIILLSALFGRVWCGWGCPQTVYMEFLFRPIERLFEGDHRAQMKRDREGADLRRVLKTLAFLVVSAVLANVFLSYFVGVERLGKWMTRSPLEHPSGFLVMAVTTGLVFFDFAYFREQMCTVVCPYARLQSVLLDKRSLVVGYDALRGEPRGKKGTTKGDCVDCKACVVACPTGIDIRNGLQLECIACTQCIDACDGVMDKLSRPRGLIRYSSQNALSRTGKTGILRARVVVYPVLIGVLLVALALVGRARTEVAEVTVLRGIGAPYVMQGESVQNHLRVKIRNRTEGAKAFHLSLEDAPGITLVAPENPLTVAGEAQTTESVFVLAPGSSFTHGVRSVLVRVRDDAGFDRKVSYQLLGPNGK